MFASAAACAATPESFLPPGLYKATRANVVRQGAHAAMARPCRLVRAEGRCGELRNTRPRQHRRAARRRGVAMPVVPTPDRRVALADLTDPPPSNLLGELSCSRRSPRPGSPSIPLSRFGWSGERNDRLRSLRRRRQARRSTSGARDGREGPSRRFAVQENRALPMEPGQVAQACSSRRSVPSTG